MLAVRVIPRLQPVSLGASLFDRKLHKTGAKAFHFRGQVPVLRCEM